MAEVLLWQRAQKRLKVVCAHLQGLSQECSRASLCELQPVHTSMQSQVPGWPAEPHNTGFCPERLRNLDKFLERIVAEGKAPMAMAAILRNGKLAHYSAAGRPNISKDATLAPDAIFRIFSITKPMVAVALLMLYEEGCFESFDEPIGKYIPCFNNLQVYVSGDKVENLETRPARTPMTIKHLLTHTSGLSYGFMPDVPIVSKLLRNNPPWKDHGQPPGQGQVVSQKEAVEWLAKIPLVCEPGTEWHYSYSYDVIGYLVEVLSGQRLEDFMRVRLFEPLGMVDTAFYVPSSKAHRLPALYLVDPVGNNMGCKYRSIEDPQKSTWLRRGSELLESGGGGLVSTCSDLLRWATFLLQEGTSPSGIRLLSEKTLRYAALNHLPGGIDLEEAARNCTQPRNVCYRHGMGWNLLGMTVMLDPARYDAVCSEGEIAWGSRASGYHWIDKSEDMAVVFLTQLIPSGAYNWRRHLHGLVYGALLTPKS